MKFLPFKLAIQRQFNKMKEHQLFRVDVDKELLWETYLSSFPEGTNPIYKERSEHDCQACKQFVRNAGSMVALVNGKLVSIWDINEDYSVDHGYQVVASALSELVKSEEIANVFLNVEKNIGIDSNLQLLESGTKTWNHLHIELPEQLVRDSYFIGSSLSDAKSSRDVFLRGLKELTLDSIDTVLDLIAQGSLYRGEEHKASLETFRKLKVDFDAIPDGNVYKDNFAWQELSNTSPNISKIRNTSIGQLLINLSEGKDLEYSVNSFEAMVAPANYKRPKALISKKMIENAQKKVEELGLTSALDRRYAVMEDVSINNVLFADRDTRSKLGGGIFDAILETVAVDSKKFKKVEEVNIEDFISNILPKVSSVEVMVENRHSNNLISLIAPVNLTAKNLFKWPNNFSWTYTGDFADSIKERVKSKGGNVTGDLLCRLSWYNFDDLDLHMIEPDGNRIHFSSMRSFRTGGFLDVDMNPCGGSVEGGKYSRSAVENIAYPNKNNMLEGVYTLQVHNYVQMEGKDVGFEVEIEFDGNIHTLHYPKMVDDKEYINVAEIRWSKKEGFSLKPLIESSQKQKTIWNIATQSWHKVNFICLSPNYWDNKPVGNKHYFFMIDNCINDSRARGFYNEFLNAELNEHRKVLEIVGAKNRVQESKDQLSGLGFSSTKRNSILCKLQGSFSRIIKIIF